MLIRKACAHDATALQNLFQALDHETTFMLFEPGERKASAQRQADIITTLNRGRSAFFVAEVTPQESAGFCVINTNQQNRNRHCASMSVGIAKNYWRQGVASQLLTAAISHCQNEGIRRLELTVRSDNPSAIALYKKFGFEVEGVRRGALVIDGVVRDEFYMGLGV